MIKEISAEQLYKRMNDEQGILILDVRSSLAFEKWRVEGKHVSAINLQLFKMKELGKEVTQVIPYDKPVVAVCEKGVVAKQTASILEGLGYDVGFLSGGMLAWSEFYETVPVYLKDSLQLYQIIRPAKGCISYLIASGNEALVVDPGRHIAIYEELARKLGVTIRHVVDTHLHADHISGGHALADVSVAKFWVPEEEMKDATRKYEPLYDQQKLRLGNENLKIICLKTPGHTISGMCILVEGKYLLSGDTLFVNGIGRPDLKGAALEMGSLLFETMTEIISRLGDGMMILPGHYSHFSEFNEHGFIGEMLFHIRQRSALLNLRDKEEFIAILLNLLGDPPPNYEVITKINQGKYEVSFNEQTELELGPNHCAVTSLQQ